MLIWRSGGGVLCKEILNAESPKSDSKIWFRGTIEKRCVQIQVQLKAGYTVPNTESINLSLLSITFLFYSLLPHAYHAQLPSLPLSSGKGPSRSVVVPLICHFEFLPSCHAEICHWIPLNIRSEEHSWPKNLILTQCFFNPFLPLKLNLKLYALSSKIFVCHEPLEILLECECSFYYLSLL